jgi:hypothetical protein
LEDLGIEGILTSKLTFKKWNGMRGTWTKSVWLNPLMQNDL